MVAGVGVDLAVFGPADVIGWLPDVVVGWTFLGGALLVRRRAPGNPLGLLMGLTGLLWFLGGIVPGLAFAHRGPLVHLLFAYPTGRLSPVGRVVVPAGYLVAVLPGTWSDEFVAVLLAGALLGAVVLHRNAAAGPIRRARQQAALVAATVGLVVVGSALARLVFPQGDADRITLLAYELSLCAAGVAVCRGVLGSTWRRAPVTDLVVQLGGDRSGEVRNALARELGDPSLQIGYRVGPGYVDVAGQPLDLPLPGSDRAATEVAHLGRPVAVLLHDPAVLTDAALLDAVAVAARLARQNARLQADVDARLAELEDSRRRLVAAADAERDRLVQRLADGAERRLAEVSDTLALAGTSAIGDTVADLSRAQGELDRTRRDLRELAGGLNPHHVRPGGIRTALRELAARCPVPVSVDVPEQPLPAGTDAAVWFVCSEAVANAVKHAGADLISVHVAVDRGAVRLTVTDDGGGGADPALGSGLRGLVDRVETLGGRVDVVSAPGEGTVVCATLPAGPVS
jgi:signal transduction histidine kinase